MINYDNLYDEVKEIFLKNNRNVEASTIEVSIAINNFVNSEITNDKEIELLKLEFNEEDILSDFIESDKYIDKYNGSYMLKTVIACIDKSYARMTRKEEFLKNMYKGGKAI